MFYLQVVINILIHDPQVDDDLLEVDDAIVLKVYLLEELLEYRWT